MMTFLLYLLALAFPTIEGALLLHLIEGRTPVLYTIERFCMGLLLGVTLSAFLLFFAVYAGIPLTLGGFLFIHIVLLCMLLLFSHWSFPKLSFPQSPRLALPTLSSLRASLPRWMLVLLFWMVLWTALKVLAGGYDIISVPTYWDDSYANWNMRAKAMHTSESLLLELPADHEFYFGGRVPSYPLTVYFTKIWFVMMTGGEWSEAVVNSISYVWFLAFLVCFFCMLMRSVGFLWSVVGTYVLVSLPLFLMHGTQPYADVFMAAYLFLILGFFLQWIQATDQHRKQVWLLLFVTTTALMLFVKNEAMLIFLPPLIFLFGVASWHSASSKKEYVRLLKIFLGIVACIAVPWMLFKFTHGLTFGNAQKVSGFVLTPNAEVPRAIEGDLLYSGNFLLLFPLFVLLLSLTSRFWKKNVVAFLIAFILIVFAGEFCIYYLTPLATEAINHTGFGRGMVHLLPLMVFASVVMLRELVGKK